MQIHVNTDNHIDGSAKLTRQVETVVLNVLCLFSDRITRVEVHLSDENSSQKFGNNDKRCVMEGRLAGLQPITVSHQSDFLEQALNGAAEKLQKTLKRALARRRDRKDRRSQAKPYESNRRALDPEELTNSHSTITAH